MLVFVVLFVIFFGTMIRGYDFKKAIKRPSFYFWSLLLAINCSTVISTVFIERDLLTKEQFLQDTEILNFTFLNEDKRILISTKDESFTIPAKSTLFKFQNNINDKRYIEKRKIFKNSWIFFDIVTGEKERIIVLPE